MQASIIKDVIHKIISINKDLNEESLVNLLIASGWDKPDIEMGKNFFNQVQPAKELSLYKESLPVIAGTINDNVLIFDTPTKLVSNMHSMYEHALVNLSAKSGSVKTALKGRENESLYAWLNIAILIVLLMILATYIMSFKW